MQGKKSNRVIVAGITGNVLEWYDFAVYGFFAPILARLFFPSEDPTVSLIAAYGAFAAGFLMRPLGAALFGHVGDRYGRKKALMLSIIMMAIPSLAIGFLPTYDQIGILAAVLLVILRMLQGVAVGGEYTTSIVYLSETAPADRRGYFSSWAMSGANGGILLGSLIGAGLSFLITDAQLQSWGWRVPFLLGVLVAASAFFLRRRMDDSKSTERLSFPLGHVIKHHWRKVVHIICLNAGFAVAYYIGFVYVSGWLVSEMHETHAEAMTINSIAIASMFVLVPLLARLSDRVGRRPLLITGAALVTLLVHPLGWVMAQPDPAYALAAQIAFAACLSVLMAPMPAALAEMFPSNIRVTAVSVGYNSSFAVFGGTAPMVATWLVGNTTDPVSFTWYISAMAGISLIAALLLKEPSRMGLMDPGSAGQSASKT